MAMVVKMAMVMKMMMARNYDDDDYIILMMIISPAKKFYRGVERGLLNRRLHPGAGGRV